MGIPSISIYVHELVTEYDVKRIMRVGSCGTVNKNVALRDVLIGAGACTDSAVNRMRFGGYDYAAIASYSLLRAAADVALQRGVRHHVGNLFSADLFYTPDVEMFDTMEAAIAREKQLKNWHRDWKISLVEGDNPDWRDLGLEMGLR